MDWRMLQQILLDKLSPVPQRRWGVTAFIFVLYCMRVAMLRSFYLITYCVGIYLLHALILFLTPKGEAIPDPFENIEEGDYVPEAIDNEFRPFVRNLPEFDFWVFVTKVLVLAFVGTFIGILDIPVHAPILVAYFLFMVGFTAKRLVAHMKRYNYNPFVQAKEYYKK